MSSFVRNCHCLPKWLYHFVSLPAVIECSFLLLCILTKFGVVLVWDFGHSNRCVVAYHYFNSDIEHLLICLFAIWVSFWWDVQVLPDLKVELFICIWFRRVFKNVFWVQVLYQMNALQKYFSPSVSFHYLQSVF